MAHMEADVAAIDPDSLPPARERIGLMEHCLAHLGAQGFIAPFLSLARSTGADQIMIFSYHADHASCLMSRNFVEESLGGRLAGEYLDRWYLQDPLYPRVMALEENALEIHRLRDVVARMSDDYRRRFYGVPNLRDKYCVIAMGAPLRIQMNLYWRSPMPECAPLVRLLGRVALMHFQRSAASDIPQALAVLSKRERDVCLGILAGKKAEIIAHELGIKPATVVTYRTRAYDKLGISSRGSLFAICRP